MPPRPLHRWKSFWLGVLVLAFLGWTWTRSTAMLETATWKAGTRGVLIGQFEGRLQFLSSSMPGVTPGFDYFRLARPAWRDPEPLFSPAIQCATHGDELRISLAYWFVILLVLFPWTAFLLWRGRRLKRLAPQVAGPDLRRF